MSTEHLGMSDEEFLEAPMPTEDEVQEEPVNEEVSEETTEVEEESEEVTLPTGEPEEQVEELAEEEESESAEEPVEGEEAPTEEPEPSQDTDYKAQYEALMAPFKANGKTMQVDNVDDARQLMSMGAGYNKKMAALKPHLKLVKMLQNNDLLEEDKLNYLIDLSKQDTGAIKKLVKDSELDPLDLDLEDTEYKPNSYTVDDKTMALNSVLDSIEESPAYAETIALMTTKWDVPSREALYQTPQDIAAINEQIENGVFAQVTEVVERERTFGRLVGLSDLQAYSQVVQAMHKQGLFQRLDQPNEQAPVPVQRLTPVVKKQSNPTLVAKRKAASSVRSATQKKTNQDYNPLEMSDAEFMKHANSKLM